MPRTERSPVAPRPLRREISALEGSRDLLPAGSHLRALFEISLDHLEMCAAHLQRSIQSPSGTASARRTQAAAARQCPSNPNANRPMHDNHRRQR